MVNIIDRSKLKDLSPSDRLVLLEELWDSFEGDPSSLPLTSEQKAELDERLAEMQKNPNRGITWEEARKSLLSDS